MLAICTVLIINFTSTPIDARVLKRAKQVCKLEYNKCLKKLIKTEELNYRAICGGSHE